jgi:hypothetical protein
VSYRTELKKLWDKIIQSNVDITEIPEGEEKEQGRNNI